MSSRRASMLFLTEDAAAQTRRTVLENLKRIDLTRPTVLTIGSDAYYHIENVLKTRADRHAPLARADLEAMERVAERHRPMLVRARKMASGRLFLLCSTPTHNDLMNQLSRHLNRHLAEVCRETGTEFLDWWSDLADPLTDRLRSCFSASAYPGDSHFSLETTGLFVAKLKAIGVLGPEVEPVANYDWSHLFECDLGTGEKTRIWCEPAISPNNAVKSHKVAASHVYGKLADLIAATLIASGPQSALYVNVRDGYLPVAMPAALVSRSVALTNSSDDAKAARMVFDFWGRSDVVLLGPGGTAGLAGFEPSLVIAATYPDTIDADIEAVNAILSTRAASASLAILLPEPDLIGRLKLAGYQLQGRVTVGHRYVPEAWQRMTIFLFSGSSPAQSAG